MATMWKLLSFLLLDKFQSLGRWHTQHSQVRKSSISGKQDRGRLLQSEASVMRTSRFGVTHWLTEIESLLSSNHLFPSAPTSATVLCPFCMHRPVFRWHLIKQGYLQPDKSQWSQELRYSLLHRLIGLQGSYKCCVDYEMCRGLFSNDFLLLSFTNPVSQE